MKLKKILKKLLDINLIDTLKILYYIISKNYSKYPSYVQNFEKLISKKFNSKYVLTFSSGTAAFYASFLSLKLRNKPEVLVSKMTFPSIITTLKMLDVNLTFFDIDKNFQPQISNLKKIDYDLIVITHPFGFMTNFEILESFKNDKTKTIFDCSHIQGLKYLNKNINEFCDISFMSIQGKKAISGGEGGLILTNNNDHYLNMIKSHHPGHSLNSFNLYAGLTDNLKLRMHPLASLLAISDLKNFERKNKKIKDKFKQIYEYIDDKNFLDYPKFNYDCTSGFHYGLPFYVKKENFKSKWPIMKYNWPIDYDYNLNPIHNISSDNFLSKLHFIDLDWIKDNSTAKVINSISKMFTDD